MLTLQQLWRQGTEALTQAGVPNPSLDARYLLLEAFHMDLTHYLMNQSKIIDSSQKNSEEQYLRWINQRQKRIPLQYLLGNQEFMGLSFAVNPNVLIPRQDTETLVELVLQESGEKRILDMCTGSGCIAISLAVLGEFKEVTGVDISKEALAVAKDNCLRLVPEKKRNRISFLESNLFENVNQKYDIIVSNPPYICSDVIKGLEPEVRDHEPMLALDGTEDGLYFYRCLTKEAGKFLHDTGKVYFEIGYDQGKQVSDLMKKAGYEETKVIKDGAGNDRVVSAVWKETGGYYV